MSDLLPTSPDTSAAEEAEPRVVGVDSDDADAMLRALTSETARSLLLSLHDEPASTSELADRLDTTIQTVQYHLRNLEEGDLVEVADTVYSEKGREMKVYAPADRPLVLFASREDEAPGVRDALSRLLAGLGVLAALSVVVQVVVDTFSTGLGAETQSAAERDAAGEALGTATGTPTAEAAASGGADLLAIGAIPPGAMFFLGGLAVLLGVTAVWYWRANR